ncbi:MAG: hypothetical protein Tsb009_29180 [Planctomycetaceae bacterium]
MIFAKIPDLDAMIEVGLWWLAVIGVLLGGIWLIVLIRTRYWGREDRMASSHQMLTQFGDLHREGDLTDDEYRSIKNRLVTQIEKSTLHSEKQEESETSG